MIPPALIEIRKPVSESNLTDLESDGAGPGHVPIPHDHHLSPPTEEVSQEMTVEDSISEVSH